MPVRRGIPLRVALAFAVVAGLALAAGCHRCHDDETSRPATSSSRGHEQIRECASLADCVTGNPCTSARCVDGTCRAALAPAGTSCDNGSVCDGVARCDADGVCRPGAPPPVDDGNVCTTDSCDPATGVHHDPVDVDDHDVCTTDSCDPRSGVAHAPVDVDDGNDCTFDSCDPEAGVTHKEPKSFYTCDADCGAGFHAVSRSASAQCGALQSFCAPDCGNAFYACGRCPARYHTASISPGPRCGGEEAAYAFCQRDDASGFYTCDAACPTGFRLVSTTPSAHCGPASPSMIRCVAAP